MVEGARAACVDEWPPPALRATSPASQGRIKRHLHPCLWPYTRPPFPAKHHPMNQHATRSSQPSSRSAIRPVRTIVRPPARSMSSCLADTRIGRVHGAKDNSYTAGVICAKVARYAERIHHPDRLLKPLLRAGAKGEGAWKEIELGRRARPRRREVHRGRGAPRQRDGLALFLRRHDGAGAARRHQPAAPRQELFRLLRHDLHQPRLDRLVSWAPGALRGPDPREMAKSDCVVIWGTNAVATQVNVMTHAIRARKERGAKIVVIDIYDNATMKQADMGLILKPGTDGALACAVMHVLFRDGLADRAYLDEIHRRSRRARSASRRPARRNGRPRSPACRSRRSRPSRAWSARRSAPSSGSATASPASATARSTCMPRCRIADRHRLLAVRGRRRLPLQLRHLQARQGADRRARRCAIPTIRHLDQSRIGPVLTGDAGRALRRPAGHGAC